MLIVVANMNKVYAPYSISNGDGLPLMCQISSWSILGKLLQLDDVIKYLANTCKFENHHLYAVVVYPHKKAQRALLPISSIVFTLSHRFLL